MANHTGRSVAALLSLTAVAISVVPASRINASASNETPPVAHPSAGASAPGALGDGERPTDLSRRALGGAMTGGPSEPTLASDNFPTDQWIAKGFRGQGVHVGIIDYFDPTVLAQQIANGAVPDIPVGQRKCFDQGAECPFGGPATRHGNAMAEAVALMAPGVDLWLAEVGTLADYYTAIDWFAVNGVKIISHSLMDVYDGPGDGTGMRAQVVDYAVAKGIAFFTTAGDAAPDLRYHTFQGSYWRGTYNDSDGDRWVQFQGTDETLTTYCGALMGLRWSDWGASKTDYELWVGDYYISTRLHGAAVLASNYDQAAGGAAPLEGNDFRWLCNTNPAYGPVYDKNKDGFVYLKVRRSSKSTAASAMGDVLELQLRNGWFEYSTAGGSAAASFADTRNPGAAAVTARTYLGSDGPTNDGRIKPDLTGPDCVATSIYGCSGDSAYVSGDSTTAAAAATAAVVLGALGPMQPWQLVEYLKANAPRVSATFPTPGGPLRPNNSDGYGSIDLRGSGPRNLPVVPRRLLGEPQRLVDTRIFTAARPTTEPLPPGASLRAAVPNLYGVGDARFVILNVTIVKAIKPGWVQVMGLPDEIPGATSNLNIEYAGQTLPNVVVVPVVDGEIIVYNRAGGHIVIDYLGEFGNPNNPSQTGGFVMVEPYRAYDSRCGECGSLAGGTYRDVPIVGTGVPGDPMGSVPSLAGTVIVSVTTDSPATSGYMSAVATSVSPPMPTSTTNFGAGRSITGLAFVPVTSGSIRIFSSATTHFQVDVLGYYGNTIVGGRFVPIRPARAVDTRQTGGPVGPSSPTALDLTGIGVPPTAVAVIGNLTSTGSSGPGEMRVGAPGSEGGNFRHLSIAAAGQIVSTAFVSQSHAAMVAVDGTTNANRIVDIAGWFSEPGIMPAGDLTEVAVQGGLISGSAISPNGDWIAYYSYDIADPNVRALRVLQRSTGIDVEVDPTEGPDQPNNTLDVMAISSDGQRIAFTSSATNITSDAATGGLFFIDREHDVLRRANVGPDAAMFSTSAIRGVDREVNRIGVVTNLGWDAADTDGQFDVYALDLATSEATFLFDTNTGDVTMSPDLQSVITNVLFLPTGSFIWSGHAPIPISSHNFVSMSPDGRYAIRVVGGTISQFDAATGTETTLCTEAAVILGLVDWSSGPLPVGNWCREYGHQAAKAVMSATGWADPLRTWDGSDPAPSGSFTLLQLTDVGVILVETQFTNLLPAAPTTPWTMYVHEPLS